jgi:hypothetical protein
MKSFFLGLFHFAVVGAGAYAAYKSGDLATAVKILGATGLVNAAAPSPFTAGKVTVTPAPPTKGGV